jgi:DnaK suppressor protein
MGFGRGTFLCYNTAMDKKILEELKESLLKEKKELTQELASFAVPDKSLKGDWDTRLENIGDDEDENAQEITEYATNVPIEHALELKLQEVKEALEKMDNGTYGFCEKCGQQLDIERLKAEPAAKTCLQHN